MRPLGFEPAIPISKRPQNHALDRAATAVGLKFTHVTKYETGSEESNLIELATAVVEFRVNSRGFVSIGIKFHSFEHFLLGLRFEPG
jgi:hypothetical protein